MIYIYIYVLTPRPRPLPVSVPRAERGSYGKCICASSYLSIDREYATEGCKISAKESKKD